MSQEIDTNLINGIETKMAQLAAKCETDFATKRDVQEMGDMLKALGKEREKHELKTKKHNVFGDQYVAEQFVDHLCSIVGSHPKLRGGDPYNIGRQHGFAVATTKAALDATTAGNGANTVPTAVSDALSILVTEFGTARKHHDVVFLHGNETLPIATDDATAAYSADDISNGSDTKQTLSTVSLSPKQMLAIYRASGKLLYNSAIDVAGMIGGALARACARLEDDTVWKGDGTSTYASQTGYKNTTTVPDTSVASKAATTIDNMLDLKYNASEVADGDGVYLISRSLRPVFKKLKGTTNDHYLLNVESKDFTIDGTPVVQVNRFDNGNTAGDMIVLYGVPRLAGAIGINRNVQIDLDTSVDFLKAGLVWRMVEDFSFVVRQPTAVSKIRVSSST